MKDCVFCDTYKIRSNVYEFQDCLIFTPLNPVTKGHLLVVHKIHSKDFTSDSKLFAETARVASQVAKMNGGDFNLITSKGESATQTVFHCHIHLVPRRKDDGLKLPWTE